MAQLVFDGCKNSGEASASAPNDQSNPWREKVVSDMTSLAKLWAPPVRAMMLCNAAGAIAAAAALAQMIGSDKPALLRAPLVMGLKEFFNGMVFIFAFILCYMAGLLAYRILYFISEWLAYHTTYRVPSRAGALLFLVWFVFGIALMAVGYSQFFCNCFTILDTVANIGEPFIDTASAAACGPSRDIVRMAADLFSWPVATSRGWCGLSSTVFDVAG